MISNGKQDLGFGLKPLMNALDRIMFAITRIIVLS